MRNLLICHLSGVSERERELGVTMYNNPTSVIAAGSAGTLAFTGANAIWLVLAGFALIAAGTALARVVPRREH
jgi:hypothetical protein